jgi:hypothetical protein
MKTLFRPLVAAGLAAPALLLGAAHAQPYGPPQGQYGQQPPSPQQMASDLRHRLTLRPDQEGALQDFVRSMTPPPGMQQKMYEQQQEMRNMPTPQRLDMMVSNMDEMRQTTLARVQATKAFYRQLTPAQQRIFDQTGQQGGGGPGE